jgi:hypothetical protein
MNGTEAAVDIVALGEATVECNQVRPGAPAVARIGNFTRAAEPFLATLAEALPDLSAG